MTEIEAQGLKVGDIVRNEKTGIEYGVSEVMEGRDLEYNFEGINNKKAALGPLCWTWLITNEWVLV